MRFLIVFLLLATCAGAVPVDPTSPDGIAAQKGLIVLCVSGEVWQFDQGQQLWRRYPLTGVDPSMPIAEIADWDFWSLQTHDGTFWYLHTTGSDPQAEWLVLPPFPCQGPIGSESSSLGGVKNMFR